MESTAVVLAGVIVEVMGTGLISLVLWRIQFRSAKQETLAEEYRCEIRRTLAEVKEGVGRVNGNVRELKVWKEEHERRHETESLHHNAVRLDCREQFQRQLDRYTKREDT